MIHACKIIYIDPLAHVRLFEFSENEKKKGKSQVTISVA